MSILGKIPDMVKSIADLEDQVKKGNRGSDIHVRGNKEFSKLFDDVEYD